MPGADRLSAGPRCSGSLLGEQQELGSSEQGWKTGLENNTSPWAGLHPHVPLQWPGGVSHGADPKQALPLRFLQLLEWQDHWCLKNNCECRGKCRERLLNSTSGSFRKLESPGLCHHRFQKFSRMRHLKLRRVFLHASPCSSYFDTSSLLKPTLKFTLSYFQQLQLLQIGNFNARSRINVIPGTRTLL